MTNKIAYILMGKESSEEGAIETYRLLTNVEKNNETRVINLLASYRGIEERTKFLEELAERFARRLSGQGILYQICLVNGARLHGECFGASQRLEDEVVKQFSQMLAGRMNKHNFSAEPPDVNSN
jgi:hypothetical protein